MKPHRQLRRCAAALCLAATAQAGAGSATYSYDDLGRLVAVVYEDGTGQVYRNDQAGNRLASYSGSPVVFSVAASASVAEGSPITLTVTKSNNPNVAATVRYAVTAGSAVATTNYTVTAPTGTLSFAAGQTTQTITVQTVNDSRYDGPISFSLRLSIPSANAAISQDTQNVTINDATAAPAFSVAPATIAEGNALSFTVSRSTATSLTQSVNYVTADGIALAGTDYTAATGTLTFAPGVTSLPVSVSTTADPSLYEGSRAMNLILSSPTNLAVLGTASAAGTITDTNSAPTLGINSPTVAASQPMGFTVTETFAAGTTGTRTPTTVNWATANGTAIAGTNYTAGSGTLTFPANGGGTQTQGFSIATQAPAGQTTALNFTAGLSGANNAAVLSPGTGTGTITVPTNQVPSAPTLSPTSQTHTTSSFTVNWTAATFNPTRYELWNTSNTTSPIYSGTALTYTGSGGTDFYLEVRACNANGCGAYSNQAHVLICPSGSCN